MSEPKKEPEKKTTNEKPVKIPIPFEDAVKAFLNTKPEDLEKAEKEEKKASD